MNKRKIQEISVEDEQPAKRLKIQEEKVSQELLDSFTCPICRNSACFCPWIFPCGEHMACYSCMVSFVNNKLLHDISYDPPTDSKTRKMFFEDTGLIECPVCKQRSPSVGESNSPSSKKKYALGHVWTSQVHPAPISTILFIEEAFKTTEDRTKKYPCPNSPECKYEATHVRMARHINEGIRNCIHCSDGQLGDNLLDMAAFISKKNKLNVIRKNPQGDWCSYISSECGWCSQKYPVIEDGCFLHLHEVCRQIPCVHSTTCQFEGKFADLQEHLKTHDRIDSLFSKYMMILNELKDMNLQKTECKNLDVVDDSLHFVLGQFLMHQMTKFDEAPQRVLSPALFKLLQDHLNKEKVKQVDNK